MWCLADMVAGVAVFAVGRSWDLVARKGVGVVLRVWDLAGLVEGLSRFAGGIFLLWRCLRASGWFLVVVWVVAKAGMCLRVVCRTTLLVICQVIVSMVNIRGRLVARVKSSE